MPAPANGRDPVQEFSQGVVALQTGDFVQAAAALQKASEDAAGNPEVWRFLGASRAGLKDWPASKAAYERALKLDPVDMPSHAGLGVALAALADPKAKEQSDWLAERVKSCNARCPDAANLNAMFGRVQDALAGKSPGPVL